MFDIEKIIDIDYLTEDRKSRKKKTQEVFTPYCIIKKLMDNISKEDWQDPTKTFLDPAMGNGNIILGILYRRIVEYGIDWKTALETCYGVELMQDNVYETHGRIIKLFDALGIDYDEDEAMDIMLRNLVCHDFFTWNFEHWRPYTFDELKQISKKKTVKKTKKTINQLEIEF